MQKQSTKYIFVTGGVTSSLGKGIIAASLAKLLQERNYKVSIQKLDPYINIDPGTLNPYEHGECFVTEDGAETDLDLGHYERFLNTPTSQNNSVTTGKIYQHVINQEREGAFLGKTVQVIPHITDEIKRRIRLLGETHQYDIIITEIGGTVGDIESLPYIEAVRQFKWEKPNDCLVIHLTLVPYLSAAGELKTKPTQHSVKALLESGVQPDILILRTEKPISAEIKRKVALFCNTKIEAVIQAIDANSIYEVPILMQQEALDKVVLEKLELSVGKTPEMKQWHDFLEQLANPKEEVNIAIIGKYVELKDAYKSINEALIHSGVAQGKKINIDWIHSEEITSENISKILSQKSGIIVAPGFGERGIDGKLIAIRFARENKIPFFGICLGMQCAVIEFAKNVLQLEDAHSSEMKPNTKNPIIDLMPEQKQLAQKGGTMRLGAYNCNVKKGSKAFEAYQKSEISERHRHRYEFNNAYQKIAEEAGLKITGYNPQTQLAEIIELENHPWFVGVQFHPEYKSTVLQPHPLFTSFINAASKHKTKK